MQLNELQRFAKNFFFKTISWLLTGVISIVIVSHLSEALLPEGFGTYNFMLTYTSYFIFLTSLGTDIVAIRMMSVDRTRIQEILGPLISLKLVLTISVFIIMLIPMLFVPKLLGYGWALVAFAITILPFPFSVQCVFEATKRMEFPSLIAIVSQVINLVLIKLFINSPDDLIPMGLILTGINVFIFACHNIIHIKNYGMWKLNFDTSMWGSFLKGGIIIGVIQIVSQMIHFFNVTLLGFMKTDYDVGIFSAAYRVIFMIMSVIAIFHNLITPIFFENFSRDIEKFKYYFNHYLRFMVFFSIFTACLSFFLAEPVLNIFYDLDKYHGSILCFQIQTASVLLLGINSPFTIGLLSMHKEKILMYVMLLQFSLNIAMNVVLIPRFGIYGSAVATIIGQTVAAPIYIAIFKKNVDIRIGKHYLLAVLSVIPVALVLHVINLHFVLETIIATITMIVSAIVFRGYTLEEIRFMRNMLLGAKNGNKTNGA